MTKVTVIVAYSVEGIVKVVPGATVQVKTLAPEEALVAEGVTDERGEVTFDIPPSSYTVDAYHPDYVFWRGILELGGSARTIYIYGTPTGLTVRVVEDSTGLPIKGLTIYVWQEGRFVAKGSTDANGYAVFRELSAGVYDVEPVEEWPIFWSYGGFEAATGVITVIRITRYIPPRQLTVDTAPVKGEVYVDGVSWGVAPQSRILDPGTYTVSFGEVAGYTKPNPQTATVTEGQTTTITGTYTPIIPPPPGQGNLVIDTTPVKGEVFVGGASWGIAPQTRSLDPRTYTVTFGDVAGYIKPNPQTATVTEGQPTTIIGTYTPKPKKPSALPAIFAFLSITAILIWKKISMHA